MRKPRIASGVAGVLLAGLFVAVVLVLRSGPTAPVPTEDPLVRLNREHADLPDNAAPLYREAFAVLRPEPPPPALAWEPGQAVPEAAAQWVAANAAAVEMALEAAHCTDCWFKLEPDANGMVVMLPEREQMRTLARLLGWRARLAAQRRDAAVLAESVAAIDAVGRHTIQTPSLLAYLTGAAVVRLAQAELLEPYMWETLTAEQRSAYAERASAWTVEVPTLQPALRIEPELSTWMYLQQVGPGGSLVGRWVAPAGRISYELHRYVDPLVKLAGKPIVQQLDPAHPLAQRLQELDREEPPIWNVPRRMARMLTPPIQRALEIRGRLVAVQRGNRTAIDVFAFRDQTGQFPPSLDAIAGDYKIDPYTGRPFLYRLTDDGFTLYSAGLDRDDDGGVHHERFGEQRSRGAGPPPPPDGDHVFWPPPQPRPAPPGDRDD